MRLDIDSGKLLYALGVLFATAALLYFVRDVVFDLSVTVKAALLLLGFVGFFVAGVALQLDVLDVVAFALSGVTYVVFVGYVVVRYRPEETGTFLLLAASAALFVGLGYALRQGVPTPSRRTAGYALGAVVLVGALLVGVDAATGDVSYELRTNDTVTITPPQQQPDDRGYTFVEKRVGSVTAANPSPFTRALALPRVRGCLLGPTAVPREDVWVAYTPGDRQDVIGGSTARTFGIEAQFPVDVNRTELTTYAVERGTSCSAERAEPTLAVSVVEDESFD